MNFLSDLFDRVKASPDQFFQVSTITLFTISSLIAIGHAIVSSFPVVPLLVAGLCVIVLAVMWTKTVVPAMLAILIVGTVVAPREYLTAIAHMISRTETPIEDYAALIAGETAEPRTADVTQDLVKTLEDAGLVLTREVEKEVSIILSERELADVWSRVDRHNATIPLDWVISGEIASQTRRYSSNEFFVEDMNLLRSEGLVSFPGTRFQDAVATEMGRQVAAFNLRDRVLLADDSSSLALVDEMPVTIPPRGEMLIIGVPSDSRHAFSSDGTAVWHRFSVQNSGTISIDVRSEESDPVIQLYDRGGSLLASDDDSGEDLGSLITLDLDPGEYFLRVREFYGRLGDYEVEVKSS